MPTVRLEREREQQTYFTTAVKIAWDIIKKVTHYQKKKKNYYSINNWSNSHHLSWVIQLMKNQWETYDRVYSISIKSSDIYHCKIYTLMWVFIIFFILQIEMEKIYFDRVTPF